MPTGEWYHLFETVSEGTPLSPPFATPEELFDWLANNKEYGGHEWSKEGAEYMVKTGFAFSLVAKNGKTYTPETMHEMPD